MKDNFLNVCTFGIVDSDPEIRTFDSGKSFCQCYVVLPNGSRVLAGCFENDGIKYGDRVSVNVSFKHTPDKTYVNYFVKVISQVNKMFIQSFNS